MFSPDALVEGILSNHRVQDFKLTKTQKDDVEKEISEIKASIESMKEQLSDSKYQELINIIESGATATRTGNFEESLRYAYLFQASRRIMPKNSFDEENRKIMLENAEELNDIIEEHEEDGFGFAASMIHFYQTEILRGVENDNVIYVSILVDALQGFQMLFNLKLNQHHAKLLKPLLPTEDDDEDEVEIDEITGVGSKILH